MKAIKWEEQHCGVHQATYPEMLSLMPDLKELIETFPENAEDFIWDVKVHMLMPGQYPCIPNWHFDNVPRVNGVQDFKLVKPEKPMYLWLSGGPLTEFRDSCESWSVQPLKWVRFTQLDEHRGVQSKDFCWRCFIRATHKDIAPPRKDNHNPLRRHCQVYLDAKTFKW